MYNDRPIKDIAMKVCESYDIEKSKEEDYEELKVSPRASLGDNNSVYEFIN